MHDLLPDWTSMPEADREKRVRELILEGKSASLISRHFRYCTRNSVIGFCNRRGIAMANRSGWAKEAIAKGRKAMAEKPKPRAKTAAKPKAPKPPKITPPAFETAPLPEEELGNDVTALVGLTRDEYRLNKHCSYGLGDPKTESFRFCGDPLHAGSHWCERHYHIVYPGVRP